MSLHFFAVKRKTGGGGRLYANNGFDGIKTTTYTSQICTIVFFVYSFAVVVISIVAKRITMSCVIRGNKISGFVRSMFEL